MQLDRLWRSARLITLAPERPGLGLIESGAIGVSQRRIAYVGPESDLPRHYRAAEEVDLAGRLVTPGLIDCHTHLVFGGDRSDEFEQRLRGVTYETILQSGGGICSTVHATRAASEDELVDTARRRLHSLLNEGVTTVEIKSGYGLNLETELRMLRAARRLGRTERVRVVTTLLAAHVTPPDLDREAYIDLVMGQIIPQVAAEMLADGVDGFCEAFAFSREELRRIFACARSYGLRVRVHADQRSDCGGASLAAECGALSADHLEWTGADGIRALAQSGTVAVVLPGAFLNLREQRLPPIEAMRRAGVRIAVATDCNPGTSPLVSLLAAMNLAAVQFGLSVDEVIAGVTREAALALGLQDEAGVIALGRWADFVVWDVERPVELVYWLGRNPLYARIWRGQ
jgi:imidazolonepropionase